MSVYIKGVDMPENCKECHFCEIERVGMARDSYCVLLWKNLQDHEAGRMGGCPLVEIPGDLVRRADALEALGRDMTGTGFCTQAKNALLSVKAIDV